MKEPKLGSGERFAKLKDKLSKQKGVKNPAALAGKIGLDKYGTERMEAMAQKGKKNT